MERQRALPALARQGVNPVAGPLPMASADANHLPKAPPANPTHGGRVGFNTGIRGGREHSVRSQPERQDVCSGPRVLSVLCAAPYLVFDSVPCRHSSRVALGAATCPCGHLVRRPPSSPGRAPAAGTTRAGLPFLERPPGGHARGQRLSGPEAEVSQIRVTIGWEGPPEIWDRGLQPRSPSGPRAPWAPTILPHLPLSPPG